MDPVWANLDEIPEMRTTRSEGFGIFMATFVVRTFQPRLKVQIDTCAPEALLAYPDIIVASKKKQSWKTSAL